ncbi:MAG: hypothetical protein HY867_11080 [Chloroflexi bacterium]|nr:hypothetical protein [Chloroflexota bacterium]
MTDSTPKIGFRQLPLALKLVVIWLGLLGFFDVIEFAIEIVGYAKDHFLNFGSLITAIIFFALAVGLINKRDSARNWTIILTGFGLLFVAVLLLLVFIFPPEASYGLIFLNIDTPLSKIQAVGLLFLSAVLEVTVLYILLRPSTKALFTPPPAPVPTPQEPT